MRWDTVQRNLAPNTLYTLTIDNIKALLGNPHGVNVTLYNPDSNETITAFD